MVKKFQVQYRVGFKWINFTEYVSEVAAREKATKMSHLCVTRVVPVWM